MLRRLRRSYRDLLAQSLQEIAWIELGFTERPDAIENAATFALRIAHQEGKNLPPESTITQVYEEANQELLILGEPGSGKSTQLLYLALELVTQAEHDETCLLPVLLPLSSWAVKQAALEEWMVEQISVIYHIPRNVSQQWVANEQILPLLDGLDEMEEGARPACIAAINASHLAHLSPLVVCSRTGEYEHAAIRQRLALQSAVVVQPLTSEQVETILARAGEAVAGLRTALQEQPALQDLATTPLILSVLMLTYQGTTVHTDSLKEATLEQRIWRDYIQRMIERKKPEGAGRYSHSQMQSWLGWLAQQMRLHQQTIFYAERIEGTWLPNTLLQASNRMAAQFPAIIIGILASLFVGLLIRWSWTYDPFLLFQVGLLGGYFGGWLSQPVRTPLDLSSEKRHIPRVPFARLWSSLLLGVLYGISFALDLRSSLSGQWLVSAGLIAGIIMTSFGWIMSDILLRLPRSSPSLPIKSIPKLRSLEIVLTSIHLRRAALIALIGGTVVGLSVGLSIGLSVDLNYGLSFGLSDGLSLGFIGLLLSLILEKGEGTVRFAERLHWNARYLLKPRHLGNSFVFAGLLFLIIGLSDVGFGLRGGLSIPLSVGLAYGLSFGLSYWFLFGFYQGIIAEQVEEKERQSFNQGIRRSLSNGFFLSLLGGGIIAGVSVLSESLTYGLIYSLNYGLSSGLPSSLSDGLNYGLSNGWFLALSSGLLIWATIGGLTVLRHYVIRFLLARSHTFPWRAQRFLDDATAQILLHRVGGGYSFVHRRLLDYFADAYASSDPRFRENDTREEAPVLF